MPWKLCLAPVSLIFPQSQTHFGLSLSVGGVFSATSLFFCPYSNQDSIQPPFGSSGIEVYIWRDHSRACEAQDLLQD